MISASVFSCGRWAVSPLVSGLLVVSLFGGDTETVGRRGENRTVLPVNQEVTPLGRQTDLAGLRPQAMALSPDGRRLVVSGKTSELIVLDPANGAILERVQLPSEKQNEPLPPTSSPNILQPDTKGQLSFTGLIFSPDGRRIFLSNVNGSVKVFAVDADGLVAASHSLPLPAANAPRRSEEIPAGLAISPDGARLYVCGNLSNTLLELDAATGKVLRAFAVGVAPYDIVLLDDKAYVSNWGGRRPGAGDLVGPAGRGTEVRVDSVRHIASEGSVSVVHLGVGESGGKPDSDILTGLHASALALSPDRRWLVCANAGADNLSVIDTRTGAVAETIWVKSKPSDLLAASPNALAFGADGKTLYVANGTQNAIAIVDFAPAGKRSELRGLLPVGWFPGALVFDGPRQQLCVANIKGHAVAPKPYRESGASGEGFNSHQYHGSVSLVPLPRNDDLPRLSQSVYDNLRQERIAESLQPPRAGQPPRAIPERIGEPSLIKHVVYVIKENRTYDQVFGAVGKGNSDPRLCIFGERVTPNQHKLVREFVLLDNTYCSGILSADGHQWSTTAFGTDYLERSFAGWPRSYPDGMGVDENDALAYSPAGFIWDNALRNKIRIRNYGEFMAPNVRWRDGRKGTPDFLACYRTWKGESDEVIFESYPMVQTIAPFSPTNYVGWEMSVPDQYRADFILRELKEYEAKGEFPQLVIICLPQDHTSGTSRNCPTPAATVADNDLAFGRIVEALSHSKFWREMAIFGIEDDPQAGYDHVSGYRTSAYVVSPYAKRGVVVSTQYNTTSLLRTMEQILGMPPMNQFDASATPMFDCFTDTLDDAPFTSVPNIVPVDEMNPDPKAIADPQLRRDALASSRMNFRQVDRAPEDALNRVLWRAMRGTREPYPEWAITVRGGQDDDDD
ncbi:MAG TPA: bifunctional YncE family protein/alkaline phosphatase family protein [Verrucomicrobiota bacterium]|nr:bifunctional YncE family protein/alkaline phosphatase family protein [Verrucomicrobiota bacterium]